MVGLKPDLGALVIGMLIASHPASAGLAKSLFNLKDLFLICFFLTIGLNGLPTHDTMLLALALVLALPLKSALYYLVYSGAHLRVRTALLSTLALTNFSEFGLIVAAIAAKAGWISHEWLVALSLALAASFMISAPQRSERAHLPSARQLAARHAGHHFAPGGQAHRARRCRGDHPRHGTDRSRRLLRAGEQVRHRDPRGGERQREAAHPARPGHERHRGDATDTDFWDKVLLSNQVNLVLLAMPHHSGNLYAIEKLRSHGFTGKIAAIVRFEDDIASLREQGWMRCSTSTTRRAAASPAMSSSGCSHADGGGGPLAREALSFTLCATSFNKTNNHGAWMAPFLSLAKEAA